MLRALSRRKMVDIAVQPHVITCGLLADLVFFGCFIPCELAVIYTTSYVKPFLLGVLHVITPCLHWERCCALLVILCTGYCKLCPFSTPSVSSFSLPLHYHLSGIVIDAFVYDAIGDWHWMREGETSQYPQGYYEQRLLNHYNTIQRRIPCLSAPGSVAIIDASSSMECLGKVLHKIAD